MLTMSFVTVVVVVIHFSMVEVGMRGGGRTLGSSGVDVTVEDPVATSGSIQNGFSALVTTFLVGSL